MTESNNGIGETGAGNEVSMFPQLLRGKGAGKFKENTKMPRRFASNVYKVKCHQYRSIPTSAKRKIKC